MKSLFKSAILALTLSTVTVLPVQAKENHSIDLDELVQVEQIILPTYDVVEFWDRVNKNSDTAEILLSYGFSGLSFYHQDLNGTVSVGFVDISSPKDTPLPYDWDFIFYMSDADSDPILMSINMHNGNSRVFRPGAFPGE